MVVTYLPYASRSGISAMMQLGPEPEVVSHGRGDKVTIIKMRRRKHYRRQAGHRQYFTEVKIKEISGGN